MNDHELMVRAAWMYYNEELTHAQIAHKLHLNRVKVTRLLKKAREKGVVEIRVTQPMPRDLEISQSLEHAFSLQQAVVVSSPTPEAIGQATAELLLYLVGAGKNIGFGWSSTVSQLAPYIPPQDKPCNCNIVDLIGSMLGKANPYSVSRQVADALQATLMPLAVPVMVSSEEAAKTLLSEDVIATTMAAARNSEAAFIGVGEVGQTNTLVELGYLQPEKMDSLQVQGAVGEVLMRYFDINGNPIRKDEDTRIIGLSWEDLQHIPNVVLVAHGPHKVDALLGALRGNIAQTLITDMPTAEALLGALHTTK